MTPDTQTVPRVILTDWFTENALFSGLQLVHALCGQPEQIVWGADLGTILDRVAKHECALS